MSSLKRLHAQGGSISHGQPNNDEGEEERKEKALVAESSGRGGESEREIDNGCLLTLI